MSDRKSYSRVKCVYTISIDDSIYARGSFRRVRALYEAMQAALDAVPVQYRPILSIAIGDYYPYTSESKCEGGDDSGK